MRTDEISQQIVYVIDDDASLRRALSRLLNTANHRVQTFASAAEFLLARDGPLRGCLLLDVRMPGGPSGIEVHQALVRQAETLPVIFMTGHGDIAMGVQAIKAGAFDFLTKPVHAEILLSTVAAALQQEAEAWRATERRRTLERRLATLTHAEYEVYRRVIAGQPNKQITAEVGSAERTVKAHRARVMTKMGALSLAELVHMADEIGGMSFAESR